MAMIHNIVTDPNFGSRYRSDSAYRGLINKYFNHPSVADLFPKMSVGTDRAGNVGFRYEPAGDRIMSFTEALTESMINPTLRSTRNYTGGADTFNTGPYSNGALNKLMTDLGYTSRVSVHRIEDPSDLNVFMAKYKPKGMDEFFGFPITNKENVNVLEVFDKSGRMLRRNEIQDQIFDNLFNQGSVHKRLKFLTSDRALETDFRGVQPKVFGFEPAQFLEGRDPNMRRKASAIAEAEQKEFARTHPGHAVPPIEDFIEDAYGKAVDSLSYISQRAHNRILNRMEKEALNEPNRELSKARLDLIAEQRKNNAFGGYSMFLANAEDVNHPGVTAEAIKGHAILLPGSANEIRAMIPGLEKFTDEEVESIDFFTSAAHFKNEMQLKKNYSFLSLEPQSPFGPARSNLLTTATFQSEFASPEFLINSAKQEIAEHTAAIAEGRITPGLRRMLEDIKSVKIDGMTPEEASEALHSKDFARRLLKTIDSGVDIRTNDYITGQLYTAMSKQYTRLRKGKAGLKMIFEGEEHPNFELSFPMQGSTRAHLDNLTDPDQLSGMLGISESGRFKFNPLDIVRNYSAMGGGDWDDSLYNLLQYDPKTKRLLSPVTRDPNEFGEKFLMDIDISGNRAIHGDIREAFASSRDLAQRIRTATGAAQAELVTQRNALNDILHKYFTGQEVVLKNGERVSQNFIKNVDLANAYDVSKPVQRRFAPKGYEATAESIANYKRLSFIRSFATSNEFPDIRKAIAEDYEMETRVGLQGHLPYKFRGSHFDEFHSRFYNKLTPQEEAVDAALRGITAGDVQRRLANEASTFGNLGSAVNAQTVIDSMFQSNIEHLSDNTLKEFYRIAESVKMGYAGREDVIDAAVKNGAAEFSQQVKKMIVQRGEQAGQIVARMQEYIEANKTGETFGIDPIDYQKWAETNSQVARAFQKGYGKKDLGFLLSETDAKSFSSNLFRGELDIKNMLEEGLQARKDAARATRLGALSGFKFTEEEMTRAQTLLQNITEAKKAHTEFFKQTPEEMLESLDYMRKTGTTVDLDVNAEAMRTLRGMGLFEEHTDKFGITRLVQTKAVERQVLAASKILAENGADLDDLMHLGESDDGSIFDIYNKAMQRVNTKGLLEEVKAGDISNFITRDSKNRLRFTERAKGFYDPVEGSQALLSKVLGLNARPFHIEESALKEKTLKNTREMAEFLLADIRKSGQMGRDEFNDMAFFVRTRTAKDALEADRLDPNIGRWLHRPVVHTYEAPGPQGLRRLAFREAADETAEAVTGRSVRQTIKSFDRELFSDAMKEPLLRKGMIGAGLFVGFGILHRLAKDPTPEEMEGPPLLPGGSPYEKFDDVDRSQVNSMYSSVSGSNGGSSILYTIQANGDFDPSTVSSGLSQLTGTSVRGNVYSGRQTLTGRPSSRSLMNTMLGR